MGTGGPKVHAARRMRSVEPLGGAIGDEAPLATSPQLEGAFTVPGPVGERALPPAGYAAEDPTPGKSPTGIRGETARRETTAGDAIDESHVRWQEPLLRTRAVSASVDEEPDAGIRAPSPLLDGQHQPQAHATTATRAGAAFDIRSSNPTDAEPTEVHVHIGRIEVTAVQESAPQRPKTPPARKSTSLDDYLAKRRRRAT
jgi:hypothetical protein